jgi:hypothetical protein
MKLYRILPGLIDSQKNKITDEFYLNKGSY